MIFLFIVFFISMFGTLFAILTRRTYKIKKTWGIVFGTSMAILFIIGIFIPKESKPLTKEQKTPLTNNQKISKISKILSINDFQPQKIIIGERMINIVDKNGKEIPGDAMLPKGFRIISGIHSFVRVEVYRKDSNFLFQNDFVKDPCNYIGKTIMPLFNESDANYAFYVFKTDFTDDHGNRSKDTYMRVKIMRSEAFKTNWKNMTPAMIIRLYQPEFLTMQTQDIADKISSEQ